MFRRSASFPLVVLCLLLLQWTAGPPPGARPAHRIGTADMASVCSAGSASPETQPLGPAPESMMGDACCWVCPGSDPVLSPGVTLRSTVVAYAPVTVMRIGAQTRALSALVSPLQPRAPPVVA